MKTLILYATKYGAATQIAGTLAKLLGGADTFNLARPDVPSLDGYERVVIGSSLYAGSIRREAKEYMELNLDKLAGKRLGLYLSGLGGEDTDKYFKNCFPEKLLTSAKAKVFAGGIFDPKKANFFERLIIRLITKKPGYQNFVNENALKKFAEEMK